MDHREAEKHLLDFVACDLDESTRNGLTSHIETCIDCRAWLETFDILVSSSDLESHSSHPESQLLAQCAVRPDERNEPGSFAVYRHLESCSCCRREVDLVRDAVLQARPGVDRPAEEMQSRTYHSWWPAVAAVCLVGLALALFFVSGSQHFMKSDLEPNPPWTDSNERGLAQKSFPDQTISGVEIEGTRVIDASGSLALNRVKIMDGAEVTIRAKEGVAFGNGFQIGRGSQVIIGVSPVSSTATVYGATTKRGKNS